MRRRLLTSMVGVLAAALLAFALPLAWLVRGLLVDRALDGLEATVDQVAVFVDDRARTCAEVDLVLGSVVEEQGLVVTLFTRDGTLVGSSTGATPTVGREVVAAAEGATGRRRGAGELAVAVPLSTRACGQQLLLQATAPDDGLRSDVVRAWAGLGGGVLAVLLLAVVVGAATADRLVRPLVSLARSATRLGEGDFGERAPRSGIPEPDAIADALDRTAERLDRAIERSRSFTADASHQLRTPLTALRLQLDLAAQLDGDARAVALDEAVVELDRLEQVVEELASLTDVGASEESVDVGALVADVVEAARPVARAAGRTIELEVLPHPAVLARPGAVRQAVQVLVDNALQHGRGAVTVGVRPTLPDAAAQGVRIVVTDEGDGPDDAAVARLMSRDRASLPPLRGGRGLRLARRLVEGEDGRLVVTPHDPTVTLVLRTT